MSGDIAIEAVIRGRVQGVWYRRWTEQEALARGLSGWVRNEPDGSVAALFAGPREAVDAMVAACRDGPPDARVDAIETAPVDPPPDLRGFRVLR